MIDTQKLKYFAKAGVKTPFLTLLHFLYPPFCLHCKVKIEVLKAALCPSCFTCIEWQSQKDLCVVCKRPLSHQNKVCCALCREHPLYIEPHHSLFSCYGPLLDVFASFKKQPSKYLAQFFASFFVLKLNELSWPLPDVIVPIFESKIETFSKKNTASLWIAKELSKMTKAPLAAIFTHTDRVEVKKRVRPFSEKNILLVTATLKENNSIKAAKQKLLTLFAKKVYSMALIEQRKSV